MANGCIVCEKRKLTIRIRVFSCRRVLHTCRQAVIAQCTDMPPFLNADSKAKTLTVHGQTLIPISIHIYPVAISLRYNICSSTVPIVWIYYVQSRVFIMFLPVLSAVLTPPRPSVHCLVCLEGRGGKIDRAVARAAFLDTGVVGRRPRGT